MKLSHEQAYKVLKQTARKVVKFRETGDHEPGQMFVGFLAKGGFGDFDDFFDAMRALNKPRSWAERDVIGQKKRASRS